MPEGAIFIQRPRPVTQVHEGQSVDLMCQTDRAFPRRTWHKDLLGSMFRDHNFKQPVKGIKTTKRVEFIGNLSTNDYSIRINNVIPGDEGKYICQATPERQDDEIGQPDLWQVTTNLKVIPAPEPTAPPSAEPASSLTTVQEHHQYSPVSHQLSASLENSADSFAPTSSAAGSSSRPPFNNNKAREALPGARELERHNQLASANPFISPSSSAFIDNYNSNHHATVRASTAYPSLTGSNSAGLAGSALVWPYLLLALAAILMLANIYLICSLIKRHTRCSKENEANEEDQDDDPSLA